MGYRICNGLGDSRESPSAEAMRTFLDALDPADEEHGAAWLTDDEGRSLEYSVDGNLCFDGSGEPRHMTSVSRATVLELWLKLAQGRIDELTLEPWRSGTRDPLPPEVLERRQREAAAWQLQQDRAFHDALGAERQDERCRSAKCRRGAVALSVFCRRHHFENIKGRPCPFET